MNKPMSTDLKLAFTAAKDMAIELGDDTLRIDYLIYSILKSSENIKKIIFDDSDNYNDILSDIYKLFKVGYNIDDDLVLEDKILSFDTHIIKILKSIDEDIITSKEVLIKSFDIDIKVIQILNDYGINKDLVISKMSNTNKNIENNPMIKTNKKQTKNATPVLDTYSEDLIKKYNNNKIDLIIGREKEIDRMMQILSRRKKNNPVLLGDAGVGKTSVVEGLAIKLSNNECPDNLQNKRLLSLDITALVSNTKFRGQFEERLKVILDEIKNSDDIILFIDEIHTIVGAGNSSNGLDISNIFKPALAKGEIRCIGATTNEEYKKTIEKDKALERRFQKISVLPPSVDETKIILNGVKDIYEKYHNVKYSKDIIDLIVNLSDRYINNRNFPDKAIDVLDEVGSITRLNIKMPTKIKDLENDLRLCNLEKTRVVKEQDYEKAAELRDRSNKLINQITLEKNNWKKNILNKPKIINVDDIYKTISLITNIPVTKLNKKETDKILQLENTINNKLIGQKEAVSAISKAIKRNYSGVRNKNKPIASFLFLGPTGVGKTELAKCLCSEMYDSDDFLIRLDMSEYSEKFNISKLIGSPPGYVGYSEGGQLTNKVKKMPYSVVLFDEIEKAHEDIYNILLQILDEGHLTDSDGTKIDFKNTIVILTSNIGVKESRTMGNSIGFNKTNNKDFIITKNLKNKFNPELLNRLDKIITFNDLDTDTINKIFDLEINKLKSRLSEINVGFDITDAVKKHLIDIGYDEDYGARSIKRIIESEIEDLIADNIIINGNNEPLKFKFSINKSKNITIKKL